MKKLKLNTLKKLISVTLTTMFLIGFNVIPANAVPCYTVESGEVRDGSSCTGNVIIDNFVTSIGPEAFASNRNITSVTIGDSVTRIEDYAFRNTDITSVIIPNSVTFIGVYSFSGTAITSVTLPNSVTQIGGYAFYECLELTSINIPSSVTFIGDYSFSGTALTSVTIPDSVTSLGDGAFDSIPTLTSVTIGNGLTSIPEDAFYNSRIASVTIPDSVEVIYDSAFQSIPTLTSVTIGNSLLELGDSFSDNPLLASVTFLGNAAPLTNPRAFFGAASRATAYVGANATGFTLIDGLWNGLIISLSIPPAGNSDSSTPRVIKTVPVDVPDADINAKNGRSLTKKEIKSMLDKNKTFKNYPVDKYKYSIFGTSKKTCAIQGNFVVALKDTGACEMWVTRTTAKGAKSKYWVKINYLK